MTYHVTILRAGSEPPTEFRIFAAGENDSSKGTFIFDADAAESVVAAFAEHGLDKLPIDFDHRMLTGGSNDAGKAAGWFVPAVRNGELWATSVTWTPAAAQALRDGEFRFISPAFTADDDGRIGRLVNVALTNLPATKGLDALVAANQHGATSPEPRTEPVSDKLFALLSADNEAEAMTIVKAWNSSMTSMLKATGADSVDSLVAKVQTNAVQAAEAIKLAQQVATLTKDANDNKRDALIAKLSEEGKAPPAMHDFLRTLSVEQVEAFGATAPTTNTEPAGTKPAGGTVTLSADEAKAAKSFGMTEAQYIEAKKDLDAPLPTGSK